jgi:DNA polymerase-3 subunit chi
MAGGPMAGEQPVLLGTGAIGNGAQALMLVDGAEPLPGEAVGLERIWVLFDGRNEAAVNRARGQWKASIAEGLAAQYWSEESGRWAKKADSAGG